MTFPRATTRSWSSPGNSPAAPSASPSRPNKACLGLAVAARRELGQSACVKTLMVLAGLVAACSSSPLDTNSAGSAGSVGSSGGSTFVDNCSAARAQQLGAIDSVSTGAVQLLSNTAGVKTLYVDATAGGQNGATTHPWIFIALGDATKASVTDVT